MTDTAAIRERFMRDPVPVRLGGLAANLARIRSFSEPPGHFEAVRQLIGESRMFVDLLVQDAGAELAAELCRLRDCLIWWEQGWPEIARRPDAVAALSVEAGQWSKRVLERSGLLNPHRSTDSAA